MTNEDMITDLLDTVRTQTIAVDKSNKRMFIVTLAIIFVIGACIAYNTYLSYNWSEFPQIRTENINKNIN